MATALGSAAWLFSALTLPACAAAAPESPLADRVVIVANGDAPDSLAVARHYAEVRHVPASNVIVLSMPVAETISWRQFVATVWQPLEDDLVRKGWIDGLAMNLHDDVGRRKYSISGHRIAALVVCRGVPLRIENDPSLFRELRPLTDHPEFRTNQGAVDSELSLLAQTDYPINASLPNPLFGNDHPSDLVLSQVVKVSRLDGPSAGDALHLVDLAVEAERTGLLGRAYVDIAGPSEIGDRWLQAAADAILAHGFDLSISHGPGTLAATARFDAPAIYLGWYAPDLNGPFALPGFRFPPGAVAVHIHSASARTLRSATEGWCGPLVARGVTATVGNVFEPYLEYTHRPDLLIKALARGDNLVDAAYYALPVLSWQSIVIGDPLYRPFEVSLSAQVRDLSALPPQLAGYAIIREMNLLDAAGKAHDATNAGKAGMREAPSLALALALARRLQASNNNDEAAWVIRGAVDTTDASAGNWALLREAAGFLSEHKRPGEAIELYRKLFSADLIPQELRSSWLAEARRVALESGDSGQAAEWSEEIGRSAEKPRGSGH